jgi:hypothetical protein
MNFFEFAENLKNYTTDKFTDDLATQLDNSKEILELQKAQWNKGEDSNGKVLGYYSQMTEILSGGKKKEGDRFNLLDTGDFRNQTYLLTMGKSNDLIFDFDSSGVNTPKLLQSIGPTIFGLQASNKEKFTQIAQDAAIELLNKNLKLK